MWITSIPYEEADGDLRSHYDRQARALREVFPNAIRFSERTGDPPHFKAFGPVPGIEDEALIGFAFYTTEVEPLERGYEGPINILVGMTVSGVITGVYVIEHHEPFGYFSIDTLGFRRQFSGMSVLDPFSVGRDVDAIARATITVSSATRVIRNSSRQIARQHLIERATSQ